jgi:hypothetical protein
VLVHPKFARWFRQVSEDKTLFGHLQALIVGLETYGRELGDPMSHPVVTSRYDMHALRRTPPYSSSPPVVRVLYAFVLDESVQPAREVAVLLHGGDKTRLGNRWYPPNVTEAEIRLEQYIRQFPHYRTLASRARGTP